MSLQKGWNDSAGDMLGTAPSVLQNPHLHLSAPGNLGGFRIKLKVVATIIPGGATKNGGNLLNLSCEGATVPE